MDNENAISMAVDLVGIRLEKNQVEFPGKDPLQHILDEIERLAKGLKEIGNKI